MLKTIATTVTATLVTATLSGLAFIAYNNPESYRRVSGVVINCAAVVLVAVTLWNTAVMVMSNHLRDRLGWQASEQPARVLEEKHVPFLWVFVAYLAVTAFLLILRFIPNAKSP